MSVFMRGDTFWYKFQFDGVEYRVSSKSKSRQKCLEAERRHRNRLEDGRNEIKDKSKRSITFSDAAERFIDEKATLKWSEKTIEMHRNSFSNHLKPFFKNMPLKQITEETITDYQIKRRKEKNASGRTINIEVSLVRMVLKKNNLWSRIADNVTMLPEKSDVGRELKDDEQIRLLKAAKESASRSLYPAILVSIHTGLRKKELRLLRWHQVDLINGTVQVGESKTENGAGRIVPLSNVALQTLQAWRAEFPEARQDHAVWPREEFDLIGQKGTFGGVVKPYKTYPEQPILSWASAWTTAKKKAKVECRWHDLRHSCASRIAARGATDQVLLDLMGWLSVKMIRTYSHVREQARKDAIARAFDAPTVEQ